MKIARYKIGSLPLPLAAGAGTVLGLGIGLPGFFLLEAPLWALPWLGLIGLLGWVGYKAEPVFEEKRPVRRRRVKDGPLEMMELPGGEFLMGSPDSDDMARDNEKPQHRVTVSSFRIGTTPVTAGLYQEVMHGETLPEVEARLPAVNVTWIDAVNFCNALSGQAKYRPCYRRFLWRWRFDSRADGYRLPTEAEWEFACRAGSKARYCFGDDPAGLDVYAWHGEDLESGVHPVASKRPNRWGLYDMHGNVWEWCWDRYGSYGRQSVKNPTGPKIGQYRVLRGGSFFSSPVNLRSASRFYDRPEGSVWTAGFRCVRVPPHLVD